MGLRRRPLLGAGQPALITPAAAALALALPLLAPAAAAAGATEQTLFAFLSGPQAVGATPTGANPGGTLWRDATGALYGTTFYGSLPYQEGTVFRLRPPRADQTSWDFSVLYSFTGGRDGRRPNADLVMDGGGALYGTTMAGPGGLTAGTAFQLAPLPGTAAWAHAVLHTFNYDWSTPLSDGQEPVAGLIMDRHGALYGTTQYGGYGYGALVDGHALVPPAQGYGTVFKLEPPDWKERVLYRFAGAEDGYAPQAALTLEPATGALYGTTANGGVVTHTDPADAPLGGGTVFKLSPPDQAHPDWTKATLYRFKGKPEGDGDVPYGKLLLDGSGALYGTTSLGGAAGCGTVFKLSPPDKDHPDWRESVLYSFKGPPKDGAFPRGGLTADAAGNLYGTTESGGAGAFGYGVVFELSPTGSGPRGWTEAVLYKFDGSSGGDGPLGELVGGGPGGHLFGVTWQGGGGGGGGTLFELTP